MTCNWLASRRWRCYTEPGRMHARRRGRALARGRGAEGATAPETLRQKDCGRKGALESSGRASTARPLTEGVSRGGSHGERPGKSLRVHDRGGISRAQSASALSEVPRVARILLGGAVARTPLYELHIALRRPDGRRSPAMRCRCSTRRASSPSICTPAPRPGCSTSRIWARCGCAAPTRRRRSKRWCPATSAGAGAEADALHAAAQRGRRHPRRSDGDARAAMGCSSSSTRRARTADLAHLRAHSDRRGVASSRIEDRALLALQGPAAAAVLARLAAGVDGDAVHERRRGDRIDGQRLSRHPLRLYRRGRVRDFGRGRRARGARRAAAGRAGGGADRPRRPRHAAARGRALPLRPRHRRDDDPGRGRSRLDHRQAAPRRRRLSRRRDHPAPTRARVRPRRRVGIRPDGRAPGARGRRRSSTPPASEIGRVTSGGFGPSLGAPIAMGYVDAAHAAPGTALALVVRGSARPARVAPLPFVPHRYHR